MAEDTKRWRRVKNVGGIIHFDGRPLENRWVKFTREWDDGRHRYQKGQVIEMSDKEKWMFYLEAGHCVPCDPPAASEKPKGPWKMGLYLMLESFATSTGAFVEGKQYELPTRVGGKYVDRGMASLVRELEDPVRRGVDPEKAVTRRG